MKVDFSKIPMEYLAVLQVLIVAVIEMNKKGRKLEVMLPIPDEIAQMLIE